MEKSLPKKRDIIDYYDKVVSELSDLRKDVRILETTDNAQAAIRVLKGVRKMRRIHKGSLSLFFNRTKKVQDEIRKAAIAKNKK